jgi:uncharacterized protein (TIGR02246 family)
MRQIFLTSISILTCAMGLSQSTGKYNSKDLAALNGLVTRWDRYWNIHNMDSMGTLLRDDVDFVNVAGQWLKGKKETVLLHKERHVIVFKNSTFTSDSAHIKYVGPGVAIMHINWQITGDVDPDGKPRIPRKGIFTWVVTKESNQWLILAAHNVNVK